MNERHSVPGRISSLVFYTDEGRYYNKEERKGVGKALLLKGKSMKVFVECNRYF